MGGPSAAIVAEELIGLGARRLVRVGTCGALATASALGDAARRRRGAVRGRHEPRARRRRARRRPTRSLTAALGARRPAPRRLVVSADLFYDPDPGAPARWAAAGAVAVEMEAATLFTVARLRGVAAGCVLLVSDRVAERRAHRRRRRCTPPSCGSARRRWRRSRR